jgi:pimeloyl-ACP methyl ester carboxylesterase
MATEQTDHAVDREVGARTSGLYTRDAGEGTPILLLHTVPLNSRMWEPQLAVLSARSRLVAPDFPGCGLSPLNRVGGEIRSLADYAEAVVGVLDALAIQRMYIVGLAAGGYVALEMLARLAARVDGLVLAGTDVSPPAPESSTELHTLAAEVEAGGSDVAAAEYLPKLFGWSSERDRPDLLPKLREIVLENTPAGIAAALRAVANRPDYTSVAEKIGCRVLCLAGEEDPLTPPEIIRKTAEKIPGARFSTIPQAGHLPNFETPESFNEALELFIF